MRAVRCRQPKPVENQMRPVAQQPSVFDRGWFSLFAVGDNDGTGVTAFSVVAHRA
jgi:hypothetical protein